MYTNLVDRFMTRFDVFRGYGSLFPFSLLGRFVEKSFGLLIGIELFDFGSSSFYHVISLGWLLIQGKDRSLLWEIENDLFILFSDAAF